MADMSVAEWEALGCHMVLTDRNRTHHRIFVAQSGPREAPPVLLLHGFPTSGYDWSRIVPLLPGFRLIAPDFLGFGLSDKPRTHIYSLIEQAEFAIQIVEKLGLHSVQVVAHDYGVSVGQELLYRAAAKTLPFAVRRMAFLNGGLYPDLHRLRPVQRLLLSPAGAAVSRLMTRRAFGRAMANILSPHHPMGAEDLDAHWSLIVRGGGNRIGHRLITYVHDRRENGAQWIAALEDSPVPLAFIWGMLDPVSGAHVMHRLDRTLTGARLLPLLDVGHYPHWEVPERVADTLAQFLTRDPTDPA